MGEISHSTAETPTEMFTCDICGKTFKYKNALNRHKRSVHENVNFSCSNCFKEFTRKENKDKHELTCDPTDDFRCPRCNKLCATAHGLKWHMSHHDQGSKRKSDDEILGPSPPKQPKSDILYQREPSPVPQPGPSSYRCRRCDGRFDNRRDLYLHNMTNHYKVGG